MIDASIVEALWALYRPVLFPLAGAEQVGLHVFEHDRVTQVFWQGHRATKILIDAVEQCADRAQPLLATIAQSFCHFKLEIFEQGIVIEAKFGGVIGVFVDPSPSGVGVLVQDPSWSPDTLRLNTLAQGVAASLTPGETFSFPTRHSAHALLALCRHHPGLSHALALQSLVPTGSSPLLLTRTLSSWILATQTYWLMAGTL